MPFRLGKIYTALAIELHQNAPTLYEAKEIHQILDEKPIVNEIQINHWFWIASYYMCNIGDVYRGALPSALLLESETIISQNKETFVDETELTDDEYLISAVSKFNKKGGHCWPPWLGEEFLTDRRWRFPPGPHPSPHSSDGSRRPGYNGLCRRRACSGLCILKELN